MTTRSWLRKLFGLPAVSPVSAHSRRVKPRAPAIEGLEDRTLLSAVSFSPPVNYTAGFHPQSVAVGDFNNDGKRDLAVGTDGGQNGLSVLLGKGDGTFNAAVNYSTSGAYVPSVAVGDFNGDGKQDLALALYTSSAVGIRLGNGDGTFQNAGSFIAGGGTQSVAVGDFNGDGRQDLVAANDLINTVSVFLGNGDGSFGAKVNYATDRSPESVAVGDFNADGKTDLAVANRFGNDVSVLLGNGNGTFAPTANYAAGSRPFSVAVGDFDGDRRPDLAVANVTNPGTVSVLLGNSNGSFRPPISYPADTSAVAVAVGDFNADGRPDLAVANNYYPGAVEVLLGNGGGTFAAAVNVPAGIGPAAVAVDDFNGDGKQDLAVANYGNTSIGLNGNVSVLLNQGVTTTDVIGPGFSIYGDSVTCTATVTSDVGTVTTGTVTFKEGTTVLAGPVPLGASGKASFSISSLGTGSHTITASYSGTVNFTPSTSDASLRVDKATPKVTWASPADIVYGTRLGGAQQNATANVAGQLAYKEAAGTVLGAGSYKLTVVFTPADIANYMPASADVPLTVVKATPSVNWADPAAIVYGTPLSGTQFNATADVPGSFKYSTTAGTVLGAGTHTLSVTFMPDDAVDYNGATASVTLTVDRATPTVTWGGPATITYGDPLRAARIDATADVAGSFSYGLPPDTILDAGFQPLVATFTPDDVADYNSVTTWVPVRVNRAILLVSADNASRHYGAANPPLSFSYGGFVNGETPATSGVTGSPSLTTTAAAGSPLGDYVITFDRGSLSAANYAFIFVDGTLSVTDESPTDIALSGSGVPEDQPAGTPVGTFSTTDPDSGDSFTYALVSGAGSADNASFTVDTAGSLKTAAVLDFAAQSSSSVRVRSTDAAGLAVEKVFIIAVSAVNDSPQASDGDAATGEATAAQIDLRPLVSDAETADADLTYQVVAGPEHGGLTPVAGQNGVFSYTPWANYSGPDSFSYSVTDADDVPLTSATRAVAIKVNPLFADSFNRPDSGTLGASYTARAGGFRIRDDQAVGQAGLNLVTLNNAVPGDVAVSADVTVPAAEGAAVGLVGRHAGTGNNYYAASVLFHNGGYRVAIARTLKGVNTTLGSRALPGFSGTGNLRFAMVGSTLAVSVNGDFRLAVRDARHKGGLVGVRSTTSAGGIANLTVNAIQASATGGQNSVPSLRERFALPDGSALGPDWATRSGKFTTRGQKAVGQGRLKLATLGALNLASVAVSADVTVAAAPRAAAGLVAGYSGLGSYYMANLSFENGSFSLSISRVVNGVSRRLTSKALPDFAGAGNLRFEAFGTTLRVFVDNTLELAVTSASFVGGQAGMRATVGGSFDNFTVNLIRST